MKKHNERKSRANNNNFNSKTNENGAQNCIARATNRANHNMANAKNDFAQSEADKNKFGY